MPTPTKTVHSILSKGENEKTVSPLGILKKIPSGEDRVKLVQALLGPVSPPTIDDVEDMLRQIDHPDSEVRFNAMMGLALTFGGIKGIANAAEGLGGTPKQIKERAQRIAGEHEWSTRPWDTKPRFEFSDEGMKLKEGWTKTSTEVRSKIDLNPTTGMYENTPSLYGKLGDMIEHPEYFKYYPEAKNAPVLITRHTKPTHPQGWYDAKTNAIAVEGTKDAGVLEALAHELQHRVQHEEGMAGGGSPETAKFALNKGPGTKVGRDAFAKFQEWGKNATELAKQTQDPFSYVYNMIAGEGEARATQRSRTMSMAERNKKGVAARFDAPLESFFSVNELYENNTAAALQKLEPSGKLGPTHSSSKGPPLELGLDVEKGYIENLKWQHRHDPLPEHIEKEAARMMEKVHQHTKEKVADAHFAVKVQEKFEQRQAERLEELLHRQEVFNKTHQPQ